MNEDQAAAMLVLLQNLQDRLDMLIWLGAAAVLGIGIIWGALQWRLWVLSKNQRHFW